MHARNGLGFALLIVLLASTSSGCMFGKLRTDKKILENWGIVRGSVDATNWDGLPIVVVAGQMLNDSNVVVGDPQVLRGPQDFSLELEVGHYIVGAFEDANDNLRHDEGERGVLSKMIEVKGSATIEGIDLVISEVFEREQVEDYVILHEQPFSQGDVVPLSDPRFGAEPAKKGLWEPASYMLENRPGLYMLEPYDPGRTPVLFVHGAGGYPQEFETLIGRLDTRRFQPWVFLYPSGYKLSDVAEFLHQTFVELESIHKIERTCVVAHSMGGLVSRGFLGFHLASPKDQSVRTLVTLASPLNGMPSARWGVKLAPAVVHSWYDIAPGSEYLSSLYETPLNPHVEYHLLFGYDKSGASDGVVPITSQLRDEAQAEAEVVRGYRASHRDILEFDAPAAQVLHALDRCRGEAETPRIAPRPIGEPE
jgi:pimeloyl-ACP methyl ester carboxylesterase